MKIYTNSNPQFVDSVEILETTDSNNAENFNVATKKIFGNTLALKSMVKEVKAAGTEEYDSTKSYAAGEYVMKDGTLYLVTSDMAAGAWDEGCVEITSVMDEMAKAVSGTDAMKLFIIGAMPNHYERESLFTTAKTAVTIPVNTQVNINGTGYCTTKDTVLSTSGIAEAGKDVYVYACVPEKGTEPKFVLSQNSTVPSGYTADNSRKIGGFHCLCADVGTISGHPLSGYVAGDILPASVWDLKHRPVSEPEGMAYIEGLGIWVDIYLASWDGSKLVSVYGGTIADGASERKYHGFKFNEDFGKAGKHLPCWDEFMVFADGSNEQTAISGAADPGTAGGHVDTAGRRMISNEGLEDCCGAMWQWMRDTSDVVATSANGTAITSSFTNGNRYINHNVFSDTATDSAGNKQLNTNWHIEPVYEGTVDSQSKGWAFSALLVRLRAGGYWSDASMCGSRSANAYHFGSYVSSCLGGRGASEPRCAA